MERLCNAKKGTGQKLKGVFLLGISNVPIHNVLPKGEAE
jgi:hypothetical protein